MDLDGATLKAFNFAQGIQYAGTEMRSADTPTSYAVPSLRSAGLAVAKTGNALSLYQNWQNNNGFNAAIEASPPGRGHPLLRGHRPGLPDRRLVEGEGALVPSSAPGPGQRTRASGGYGIGSPPTVVPVPHGDEGWVEPATTQSATSGGAPNPPVYVPEYLMRWAGWSLAGRPSGQAPVRRALRRPGARRREPGQRQPRPRDRLRGRRRGPCRRCASVAPTASGQGRWTSRATASRSPSRAASHGPARAVTYRRFEPVPSPVLVPTAPRTPGEHLENLVIRSNYDIPDSDPSIVPVRAPHRSAVHGRGHGRDCTASSTGPTATRTPRATA